MTVQLTSRDRRILSHVCRYRITTNEVLLRLFFSETGENALKTVRKRLLNHHIQSRLLGIEKRRYYQLTPCGARSRGEPREIAKPLGAQALPRVYGVLAYCCLLGERRKRLNRLELRQHYPEFAVRRLSNQADYCIEQWAGDYRLTRILVDQGASPEHVVNKCEDILHTAGHTAEGFSDMVQQEVFALAIVVAEKSKQAAISRLLVRQPLPVPVTYGVVPDLTALLER